jgi:hypothetical protein
VLAAGFDAMLRITDANGVTLAFNHDGPSCMDPLLVFTAPADGKYVVQTMGHKYPAATDIRFQGGQDCVYRLHLTTGPLVRHAWPLALPGQHTGPVTVEGWNLAGQQFEKEQLPPFLFPAPVSALPEVTESASPQTLAIPSAVSGRIAARGEMDQYLFSAKKGETIDLSLSGPDLGSEMDAKVRVLNQQGGELAANDDANGSTEPHLLWTAPDYYYRVSLTKPVPGVKATVAGHAFKLEAGGSTDIKISVVLENGFCSPLILGASQLPAGISAAEVQVAEKGGEVTLTLKAEKTVQPVSQPFQLTLTDKANSASWPVTYRMISTSENNGVPQGYRKLLINETASFWLTVRSPSPPAP